eukprot:360718-Chlamydomonas_euryale.AAC.2
MAECKRRARFTLLRSPVHAGTGVCRFRAGGCPGRRIRSQEAAVADLRMRLGDLQSVLHDVDQRGGLFLPPPTPFSRVCPAPCPARCRPQPTCACGLVMSGWCFMMLIRNVSVLICDSRKLLYDGRSAGGSDASSGPGIEAASTASTIAGMMCCSWDVMRMTWHRKSTAGGGMRGGASARAARTRGERMTLHR